MQASIYLKIFLATFISSILVVKVPLVRAQEINLEDNLILYLPMNGNAQDESGNNVPTLVEGAVLTSDRFGNPDQAYLFNGIDDNINLNNDQALITEKQFTICMWARIDGRSESSSTGNGLFEQRDDHIISNPVAIHLTAEWYGDTYVQIRSDADPELHELQCEAPNDFTWNHYVFMIDANKNSYLFINGELRDTGTFPNDGGFTFGVNRVNIGRFHPEGKITAAFNGAIDEVLIYNRSLNFCEIEALYSGQLLKER